MGKRSVALGSLMFLAQLSGLATAAPVLYSFSTGTNTSSPIAELLGTKVFGGFQYDAAAPLTFTTLASQNPASASVYGVVPTDPVFPSSIMDVTGHIADLSTSNGTNMPMFFDPRGQTTVSNDGRSSSAGVPLSGPGPQDYIALDADPAVGTLNFSGFTIGGYMAVNLRLFWTEDTLGGDFLTNQNLPGILPSGPARLSLDFVPVGNPGAQRTFVFYNDVSVSVVPPPPGDPMSPIPEPETYAMLLAGLALLGFAARRRTSASI